MAAGAPAHPALHSLLLLLLLLLLLRRRRRRRLWHGRLPCLRRPERWLLNWLLCQLLMLHWLLRQRLLLLLLRRQWLRQ